MTTLVKTGYAPVNGLELYHEIRGSGDPLVLLHGGVVGMTMFDSILPELASGRQVISVDLQGHGRTADIDRPLSFPTMADDIVALLKHLGFENADAIMPEHIVQFFGLLGGGQHDAGLDGSRRPEAQLAVLPGVTHYTISGS